jgi:hypothetical protein
MGTLKKETENNLTKELYESPAKDKNVEKYGVIGNQCICCMKPLKENKIITWVHVNTDYMALNPKLINEENCIELTGAESQGCFKIGNSCAKKMKGFTFKRTKY